MRAELVQLSKTKLKTSDILLTVDITKEQLISSEQIAMMDCRDL
jgi:hypothetical protein